MQGTNTSAIKHVIKICFAAALTVLSCADHLQAQSAEDLLRLGTQILKGLGTDSRPVVNNPAPAPKNKKAEKQHSQIVADAQRLLAALGYPVGTVDGRYGNQTKLAIIAFQQNSGLPATGLVDEFLIGALTMAQRNGKRPPSSQAQSSPSFDCSKARSITEQTICASTDLADLDRQLAAAYPGAASAGLTTREEQTRWLRGREACGGAETCITNAYRSRLAELGAAAYSDQPTSVSTSVPELDLSLDESDDGEEQSAQETLDAAVAQPGIQQQEPLVEEQPSKFDSNATTSEVVNDRIRRIRRMCEADMNMSVQYKCGCLVALAHAELAKDNTLSPNNVLFRVVSEHGSTCSNPEAIRAQNLSVCTETYQLGGYKTNLSLPSFCQCYADNLPEMGARAIGICQTADVYPFPPDTPQTK